MPPDDELARHLATLDHGDLVRRLRSLAERDDSLQRALTAEAASAPGSSRCGRRFRRGLHRANERADRTRAGSRSPSFASSEARPDDAVRVYASLVNEALEVADDRHYDRVVDLLGRYRATRQLHGRAKELELQVAAIRERYARRTRLLKRMDRAGLS